MTFLGLIIIGSFDQRVDEFGRVTMRSEKSPPVISDAEAQLRLAGISCRFVPDSLGCASTSGIDG